jgi:hypothetical protein
MKSCVPPWRLAAWPTGLNTGDDLYRGAVSHGAEELAMGVPKPGDQKRPDRSSAAVSSCRAGEITTCSPG